MSNEQISKEAGRITYGNPDAWKVPAALAGIGTTLGATGGAVGAGAIGAGGGTQSALEGGVKGSLAGGVLGSLAVALPVAIAHLTSRRGVSPSIRSGPKGLMGLMGLTGATGAAVGAPVGGAIGAARGVFSGNKTDEKAKQLTSEKTTVTEKKPVVKDSKPADKPEEKTASVLMLKQAQALLQKRAGLEALFKALRGTGVNKMLQGGMMKHVSPHLRSIQKGMGQVQHVGSALAPTGKALSKPVGKAITTLNQNPLAAGVGAAGATGLAATLASLLGGGKSV